MTSLLRVDSQPTVGDSLLVQVTGELSSNDDGELKRRFTQTFVLAPHNSTQLHILNDIFRYQDEDFPDVAEDEEFEDGDRKYLFDFC